MGLTMYGQMTAGSWIYIGSQGIVQGTFETFSLLPGGTFRRIARRKIRFTGGLGGMGGAQPLAATMNGACLPRHRRRSQADREAIEKRIL